MNGLLSKFLVLKGAIPELWLVFGIKFLAVAAYGVTNSTIALWLSSDLGFNDKQALAMVAAWSGLMTVVTLLVGPLTDVLGLRRTFFLGAGLCVLARAVMCFASQPMLALIGGLIPLAIGEALGVPVLIAAVRRYSGVHQRSISFSIFYTMMNLGFLIASFVFDFVRQGLGEHGRINIPLVGSQITTYRTLFLVGLLFEILLLPLIYFLRPGADGTETAPERGGGGELQKHEFHRSIRTSLRESVTETIRLFSGLVKQPGVYRLLGFLVLISFLKLIFMQMYYVYPKFGIRELGEGAPIGRLWATNSLLIIFLVPVVGALTQRFQAYAMVCLGGVICAVSVFVMALPPSWFLGMAHGFLGDWIGHGYLGLKGPVHPYYVMIFLFVALLSIGESFYSPRVYEYAAAIAPRGQEASYGALSYVPFLMAKLLVGTISGSLLAKYCPPEPPRNSGMLWLIIALMTTIAPIGLVLFKRHLRVSEAGREALA